uniref:Uncharacterized protein n=1 Tax=Marseillevirus LCMAC201 TaxID=2506605 RepID=A0A481YVV3_9VIRU|nr:MAG: hypothetical protein LCMAC201_01310 [Marseillevirus LCMAC201]
MTKALVCNRKLGVQASSGQVSVEELVKTIFTNDSERNVFLYNIEMFNKYTNNTWYWYGDGSNGKTTLMKALVYNYAYKQLDGDGDEVYSHNGNIIKITNFKPDNAPSELVTHFRQNFI